MEEEEKAEEKGEFCDKNRSVWGKKCGLRPQSFPLSLYVGRIGCRPHLGHLGCLFGLAVECATAKLSTRTGLIS